MEQIQGLWRVRHQNISGWYEEAKKLKDKFLFFQITHVLRVGFMVSFSLFVFWFMFPSTLSKYLICLCTGALVWATYFSKCLCFVTLGPIVISCYWSLKHFLFCFQGFNSDADAQANLGVKLAGETCFFLFFFFCSFKLIKSLFVPRSISLMFMGFCCCRWSSSGGR